VIDTTREFAPVQIKIPATQSPQWLALQTEIDVFAEILWPFSPARAAGADRHGSMT
jgi:hypothetical protein